MLRLNKPKLRFSDLDAPYQNHFIKEYALAGVIFVSATIICILIKAYLYILFCFLIFMGYALYLYWQIYLSLTNKILVIDCKCTDIEKKEHSLFSSKDFVSKTCTISLEDNKGHKFTQPIPFSSEYKIGDTVRIYANERSISQINKNTYTVINPIFMHCLAS